MWYYSSEIIKNPKAMVINTITYPKAIFRDSTTLTSLGIKPYREVMPSNNRYYTTGSYTVDATGNEVVGTYASVAKNVADLKAQMLLDINQEVLQRQSAIDWYESCC